MNQRSFLFAIAIVTATIYCRDLMAEPPTNGRQSALTKTDEFRSWGEDALRTIEDDFWLPESNLYAEWAQPTVPIEQQRPAFMWSAGVQVSALAAATSLDQKQHGPKLTRYIDALQKYWHEHNGIGGYDVLPNTQKPDRYYDDNAWIVLALLDSYTTTNDLKHLARAAETFTFVLSGEDQVLGGGVYWRENRQKSKNTCSNAPAIVAALRLYQQTNQPRYLNIARRLYVWTHARLQDRESGLFLDNLRLSGEVDRRIFSYNSAVMIEANCLFYQVTDDPKYLHEAQRIANAAEARWIDLETGAVRDSGKFAHMLLESLIALWQCDSDPHWIRVAKKSLTYVHEELRDSAGHYPVRWNQPPTAPLQKFQLIDQASAARAFLVISAALLSE